MTRDIRDQVGREVPDGPASGQEGSAWEGEARSEEAAARVADPHRGCAGTGSVEGGLLGVFPLPRYSQVIQGIPTDAFLVLESSNHDTRGYSLLLSESKHGGF